MTQILRATYFPGTEDATAATTVAGNTVVFPATNLLTDAKLVPGKSVFTFYLDRLNIKKYRHRSDVFMPSF